MFMYTHPFSCAYRFYPDPISVPVFIRRLHPTLQSGLQPDRTSEAAPQESLSRWVHHQERRGTPREATRLHPSNDAQAETCPIRLQHA